MATKPKATPELVPFYGGRVQIEKRPWGDHFRYTIDGRSGILSATGITKYLDKSGALLPWAVSLVGSHVTSTFESKEGSMFSKEEIFMVVGEAVRKPEEAKIAGGKTGDIIHDFAHAFAKAEISGQEMPKIPDLDESTEEGKKALNGISAFLDWYNEHDVEFLQMETLVYYNSLLAGDTKEGEPVIEFLGIIDLLARVDGVVGVWDYKTGKKVYTDQRYQVSLYRKAHNSGRTQGDPLIAKTSGVISFNKETGGLTICQVSPEESEKDLRAALGLYAVAVREKELDAEYKKSTEKSK